jgi:hypothetical protein
MPQGYDDTVLRAELLEKELNKARKHSAMLQSKLDGAFAQYHNEVQEMQAKSDDLRTSRCVRRTKVCHRQVVEYLLRIPYSSLICILELLQILRPG